MTYLKAIVLGLVQGIAEFLPISSSGHLKIFESIMGLPNVEEGQYMLFDVLLHFGTLIAIFAAYRKEIAEILNELLRMLHIKKMPRRARPNIPARRMIVMLILATLPLVLVLPIKDAVESIGSMLFVGFALLVTGVLLFFADRTPHGEKNERSVSVKDALCVGLAQACATVPGLSRSGTTICAGLARGFERQFAVRFSFLLSIPAVLGATLLELIDAIQVGLDTSLLPMYLVGVLFATVSGYLSIRLLKYITSKDAFGGFAYYCWGAGLVAIILSLLGV